MVLFLGLEVAAAGVVASSFSSIRNTLSEAAKSVGLVSEGDADEEAQGSSSAASPSTPAPQPGLMARWMNSPAGRSISSGLGSFRETRRAYFYAPAMPALYGPPDDSDEPSGPLEPRTPANPLHLARRAAKLTQNQENIDPSSPAAEPAPAHKHSPLRWAENLQCIARALPARFGDTGGAWHLLFSTARDGTSLAHCLRTSANAGAVLVLVTTRDGRCFGGFLAGGLREPGVHSTVRRARALSVRRF